MEKWIIAKMLYGSFLEFKVCETCHCIKDTSARPVTSKGEEPIRDFKDLTPCRCDHVKFELKGSV